MTIKISTFFTLLIVMIISSCGGGSGNNDEGKFKPQKMLTYEEAVADWQNQKGIGPIKSIELGAFDAELAKRGEEIYILKCTACHTPEEEKLGPAPQGIFERRTPEWIMNMILNPEDMAKKDPIGRGLLMKYNTVMADQGLTEEDARAVLEFFRTLD